MKIIKYILAILVCFALLNGCVRGTLNKPLLIPSTPSIDNEKATVKFYRSSDSFGFLRITPVVVQIDFDQKNNNLYYILIKRIAFFSSVLPRFFLLLPKTSGSL